MNTVTKNADGTFTVAGMITCLSEEAAMALLDGTAEHGIIDPLTIEADRRQIVYGYRVIYDEISRMPRVEFTTDLVVKG